MKLSKQGGLEDSFLEKTETEKALSKSVLFVLTVSRSAVSFINGFFFLVQCLFTATTKTMVEVLLVVLHIPSKSQLQVRSDFLKTSLNIYNIDK